MEPNLSNFTAYVDESGCSGDKYGTGSSSFLAMGAVIVRDDFLQDAVSVFKEAREEIGHKNEFRKFSEENDKRRFVLCRGLAGKRLRTAFVAIHKPSLAGSYIRDNHANEYNYLLKMLIERISWAVRDAPQIAGQVTGTCRLVLSEQRMWPYPEMFSYLQKLRGGSHNCKAHWPAMSGAEPDVVKHLNEQPIHIADLAASAFAMAIEPKMHGITDDRFFRLFGPTIYSKYGRKFGLKIFPDKEMQEQSTKLLKLL